MHTWLIVLCMFLMVLASPVIALVLGVGWVVGAIATCIMSMTEGMGWT